MRRRTEPPSESSATRPLRRAAPAALLALLAAAGCSARGGARPSAGGNAALRTSLVGAPIAPRRAPEFAEIARLESTRTLEGGRLLALLRHADPAVRARAALALGRFPAAVVEESGTAAEIAGALGRALGDPEASVRADVAFALGLRADASTAGLLRGHLQESDALVRARMVEASSRIGAVMVPELVLALGDPDERVRIEAAVGASRLDAKDARAGEVDAALVASVAPVDRRTPAFVRAVLFALERRGSSHGRAAFLEHCGSPDVETRIFAVRGLGKSPPDEAALAAVRAAFEDPDWRVACEAAVVAGAWAKPDLLPALTEAVEHGSAHVRRNALEAVGALASERARVQPLLERGLRDLSASARAAALVSLARMLPSGEAQAAVEAAVLDPDPVVRRGAADAAAKLRNGGLPVVERLMRDRTPFVSTQAVEVLGRIQTPRAREIAWSELASSDNGARLAAVLALAEAPEPADVEPLACAARETRGDIAAEVAYNAARVLGAIGGDAAHQALLELAAHADPYVRSEARRVLRDRFGEATPPAAPPAPARSDRAAQPEVVWLQNPVAEIETTRGTMVFELFAGEAPAHVRNFVEIALHGEYDGLTFHRVVPDFVVQGGDYRGDGNGGKVWDGGSLGAEFTPRKFVRGTLGMPRNDDPDSAGSQFFVTHRSTPHLDGRYTAFGELRAGAEVLDRIEVGDRILAVRVRVGSEGR